MKIILLCAVLTATPSPALWAQNAPNREGLGETPGGVPERPDSNNPAASGDEKRSDDPHASKKSADERFIHQAGKAGKMEVKLAQQGAGRSTRDDLKAFAAMLVKDHGAANMELAHIAKSMGVEIPEPSKKETHGKTVNKPAENDASGRKVGGAATAEENKSPDEDAHALEGKSGMEFDAAFMKIMEECHAKDIALFEKSGVEVQSVELKGFITKTLPVLKKHAAALAALERKDPNRPDAKAGSPAPAAGGNTGSGASNTPPEPNR